MSASDLKSLSIWSRGWTWLIVVLLGVPVATSLTSNKDALRPRPEPRTPLAGPQNAVKDEPDGYCLARLASPVERRSGERIASESFRGLLEQMRDVLSSSLGAVRLSGMVALVPDPLESGLSYLSEVALRSLQSGMAVSPAEASEQGRPFGAFLREDSWLPWDDRHVPGGESRRKAADCRFSVPGLVLFRNVSGGSEELKLVFVVGETPLSGAHRGALDRALEGAAYMNGPRSWQYPEGQLCGEQDDPGAWCGAQPAYLRRGQSALPPGRPLRVLGPTFSGGAWTLRKALAVLPGELAARIDYVDVVSGSASAIEADYFLRNSAPPVRFARTIPSERALNAAFAKHLCDIGMREGVALLHEQGTEFGTLNRNELSAETQTCNLQVLSMAFPFGISAIRDAYEELDRNSERSPKIARTTTLDLSLQEPYRALNLESEPSPRTNHARDVALTHILGEISRRAIGVVGIQATDIGDAIFLARKIRDVAPDVRLAFFEADELLKHPAHRQELLGSLVVSAYPFLGAHDFSLDKRTRQPTVFESSFAVGVHNAVAALREAPETALEGYLPSSGAAPLPVWIAAVGHQGFVPLRLYPANEPGGEPARTALYRAPGAVLEHGPPELKPEREITSPKLWLFVLAAWTVLGIWDLLRQRSEIGAIELEGRRAAVDGELHSDHDWDLEAIRVKCMLHGWLRSGAIAFALVYMSFVHWRTCFMASVPPSWNDWRGGALYLFIATLPAVLASAHAFYRAARYARYQWRFSEEAPPSHRPHANGQPAEGAAEEERVSFPLGIAQRVRWGLRLTGLAVVLLTSWLCGCTFAHLVPRETACKALITLLGLRSMNLASGLSPAAPLLIGTLCVFIWAKGRGVRLVLAHRAAHMAASDGVHDGVSTPLSAIVLPCGVHGGIARTQRRKGFVADERNLVNALIHSTVELRPTLLMVALAAAPVVFFVLLKQPSTLGARWEDLLLFSILAICTMITILVVLQLSRYWLSLQNLLKRVLEHPIGESLVRVQEFARDRISDMVSRAPGEVLRLSACVVLARELIATAPRGFAHSDHPFFRRYRDADLELARSNALRHPAARQEASVDAARLGLLVSDLGKHGMQVLEDWWSRRPAGASAESAWIERLESFVSTVIALVIARYVRQFKYFVVSATVCASLLVLAVTSYAFEPQRALLTCVLLVMALVITVTVAVYVGLDRNTALSHISGSDPNRVTLDSGVLSGAFTWILLPLLFVLAAYYPDIANRVYGALEPILRAVK